MCSVHSIQIFIRLYYLLICEYLDKLNFILIHILYLTLRKVYVYLLPVK